MNPSEKEQLLFSIQNIIVRIIEKIGTRTIWNHIQIR